MRQKIKEILILAVILSAAVGLRIFLLLTRGFAIFEADQSIVGLMAKHILQGHFTIYYWGQGYMGSIEAFAAALIFAAAGMSVFTLQLAPLSFYVLFLIVHFCLLKKTLGLQVSVVAGILLAASPVGLSILSITSLGGYPETLFFSSLVTLGLLNWQNSKKPGFMLFLTGLAAGIGFWTNNLIVLSFLALAWFFILRTPWWAEHYKPDILTRFLLLRDFRIPLPLKILLIGFHFYFLFYTANQIVTFFAGADHVFHVLGLHYKTHGPVFHVKKIKRFIGCFILEGTVLAFFSYGLQKIWNSVRQWLPLGAGVLLGASPVIAFSLMGGNGYRLIHGSGMIYARELGAQWKDVILNGAVQNVLGIQLDYLHGAGVNTLIAWSMLILVMGTIIAFIYNSRKEIGTAMLFKPYRYSYACLAWMLAVIVLAVCFASDLRSARYLLLLYIAVNLFTAVVITKLFSKNIFLGLGLLAAFLFFYVQGTYDWILQHPAKAELSADYQTILGRMRTKGVQGGYAHYIFSYPMTFLAREEVIVAPYLSPDRYPAYTHYVQGLDKAAYIFREGDGQAANLEQKLQLQKRSFEKEKIGLFQIYFVTQ